MLLRGFRLAAELTQQALADRAKLGLETVSALERGIRRVPNRKTFELLAAALNLTPAERSQMAAAAKRTPRTKSAEKQPPSNVPLVATPLVGRDSVVTEIIELVRIQRLVTLVGPGGVGKTRVAIQVATALRAEFAEGVCFIDMAPIADSGAVAGSIATALGLEHSSDRPVIGLLVASLKRRKLLLVLDCCEHLVSEAASVADAILCTCPNVHILATTREILKTAGEQVFHIPPLTLPPLRRSMSVEEALQFGAVALFVDRARAADRSFRLGVPDVGPVAEICRQLDGIALAN